MTRPPEAVAEAAADLRPYLPRLVLGWEEADEGARVVDGTLVSLDISGFTSLSERLAGKGRIGAEELILLISGIFEGLIGIADRHGGDVLKFRGDALLLLFAGPDHERRACHAASDMQWFIETAGSRTSSVGPVELRMSTGIFTGECQFFLVESTHRELLVTGPAATATYRLEDASEAGEILVSPATAAALPSDWLGERRGDDVLIIRRPPGEDSDAPPTVAAARAGDLGLYVPAPLRDHLAVASGEAEHRYATVAFVRFSGTDAVIAEDGAEALHPQLQALARVVAESCERYGVTWLESDIDVDGGKLYLTAGAPSSTGEDEEGMIRALREIVDAGEGPPVSAGTNRGLVFAGDIGATTRRTYAVMGDTVNLAARLTGRAAPGEIRATEEVLERARTRYETEKQPLLVKGKERPVTAYRVGAPTGVREVAVLRSLALVGREAELETLRAAVDGARMRTQHLVELVGEPGIGKSRLVEELRTLALGFTPLGAAAEQYASSVPFFSFRNLLRQLAGITPDQTREAAGAQLAPWVQTVMPDLAPWLPLLAIPFDADVPSTPEAEGLDPQASRDRLHDTVEQFLQRVLMMPTLLVFEDAHWLDDASHFLLLHLTAKPAPRPWLICVTRRPEGGAVVREGAPGVRLDLEPLTADAVGALALAAAEEFALSAEALSALTDRSGGNPLFVRELVTATREGAQVDTLPETVETLLTARIDTLPPADRMLLRYASVVGPAFELDLLAEVLAGEIPDVGEPARWERLREFVAWTGEGAFAFRHDLFRATAYAGLSFRRRREIHGRLAEALEARAAGRVGEVAGLLSLHFEQAGDHAHAWRYAVTAGEQARRKLANVVAAELYERALAAAEHLPELAVEEVAQVSEALGDVSERFARFDRAGAAYERAHDLLSEDPLGRARLLLKQGDLRERSGAYDEALEWYGRGLQLADDGSDLGALGLRARLELGRAGVLYRQAEYQEGIRWAEQAAADAERAGDRDTLAHAWHVVGAIHSDLSSRDGVPYLERALALYEELADVNGQGTVLNFLGIDAYYQGRWNEALAFYARAREAKELAGDVIGAAIQKNNEAEILSDQGRLEEAGAAFGDALRTFRAAGYRWGVGVQQSNLGRVAARRGHFAEAHTLLEEARTLLRELGSDRYAAEADARKAECLVLEGRHREALELALETRESAGSLAVGGLQSLLERVIGYALHQARQPEEARPHFAESLRIARELNAEYEVALTLKAMADTGYPAEFDAGAESRAILDRLGVVSVPLAPLP